MIINSLQFIPSGAKRLLVAFSGGLDSSVLLHLVANHRQHLPVQAWHVNHGLQPAADSMEAFCQQAAEKLGIPLRIDRLQLDQHKGNLESRAREARYRLFRQQAKPGDCILTAHHQADQAETFLLNLFRGSGVRGLSGIAPIRQLGLAQLVRPLLQLSQQQLQDYASEHALDWFDDPSNVELKYDRNYLRHQIMPLLQVRWPSVERKISASCDWQAEAQQLLDDLAVQDLDACQFRSEWGNALELAGLRQLSAARVRNLIRHWLSEQGADPLPAKRLETLMKQLSADNRAAEISMPGYRLRSFDEKLFLVQESDVSVQNPGYFEFGQAPVVELPGSATVWSRQQVFEQLGLEDLQQSLSVGFRQAVADQQVSRHQLKHFYQSRRIPPWRRASIPLIFVDQRLSGYLS